MGAYRQQAFVALQMYLKRGLALGEALEREEFDQAEALVFWRNAAFHNFRAALEYEHSHGNDLAMDHEFIALGQKIALANQKLEQQFTNAQQRLNQEWLATERGRQTIRKYHSGQQIQHRFYNHV
jgi:hypothetical protein